MSKLLHPPLTLGVIKYHQVVMYRKKLLWTTESGIRSESGFNGTLGQDLWNYWWIWIPLDLNPRGILDEIWIWLKIWVAIDCAGWMNKDEINSMTSWDMGLLTWCSSLLKSCCDLRSITISLSITLAANHLPPLLKKKKETGIWFIG